MEPITGASGSVAVDGVPRQHITIVWPKVWPHLQKAIARFPDVVEPYTEERVLEMIHTEAGQLWVAWDTSTDDCKGAVLTEITNRVRYPERRFLEVPLVGGEGFAVWGIPLFKLLCDFGRAHNCTDIVGFGRRGWTRLLGFHEHGTTDDGIPVMYRPLMEN